MTDRERNAENELLDAYLDGLMSPGERETFEALLARSPELAAQAQLQAHIDESLRRKMRPPQPSGSEIDCMLPHDARQQKATRTPPSRRTTLVVMLSATAAAVAWILVAWQLADHHVDEPFFEPRPLVQIYQESVQNSFRPYYDCSEPKRFAETFANRQDEPLRLAVLPEGRRMLGLSYSGGFSRNTTAILCKVPQPVIVFVDRLSEDKPQITTSDDTDLNIFRRELGDLVLYEVTPLEEPTISEYLQLAR